MTYKKDMLLKVYIPTVLKIGDKFYLDKDNFYNEFDDKIIEIVEIKNETTYMVKVNDELYEMPFNITMFENAVLIRE